MSLPTGLEDTAAMKQFEERLRAMSQEEFEGYINYYIDDLHKDAEGIGKKGLKDKLGMLQQAAATFLVGSKKADPENIKKFQEIITIMFYVIGDASWDEPNVRLARAIVRRTKLYNVLRAAWGVEDLPPGDVPDPNAMTEDYIIARLNFLRGQIVILEDALAKVQGSPPEEGKEKIIKVDD